MAQVAYILPIDFPMRPKLMLLDILADPDLKQVQTSTHKSSSRKISVNATVTNPSCDLVISSALRHQYACFKETIAFITQQLKELEKIKLKIVNDIIDVKTTPILYLNTPNYDDFIEIISDNTLNSASYNRQLDLQ
ncbi:uncharacterized protein TRIADDRAFT_62593 [Trichoplax adhaerens]|uniref:Uncharacterized protein n=1 Tax=Trichoplax adhaerens TaxID=10228 RepID=B3SE96_TRIAD|nr:predicted protein [Trichoplax adhaerens]EDV18949.1 predicted protein [Trichoplax adhaerens]|eukprot:XP_002118565.1 predicted protein [Trichoplax adhaerens]